jgi:hypothetical protein
MGQDPGEVGAQQLDDDSQKSPEQLRAEIEETREDLGDTVEALAAKTDVKARARERAEEVKRSALRKRDELLSKVKRSSPAGEGGPSAAEPAVPPLDGASTGGRTITVGQLKDLARENPVATAAFAAFVGGIAFARLLSRP